MLTAEARAEFLADLVPEEELQVSCDWWRPGHVTRCSPLIGPEEELQLAAPAAWDWEQQGAVGSVKTQKQVGGVLKVQYSTCHNMLPASLA